MRLPFAFSLGALVAFLKAETPVLTFPPQTLPPTPRSLAESLLAPSSAPEAGAPIIAFSTLHRPRGATASVDRMPVLKPKATIDPKMVISPDESIDYKLRVLRPRDAGGSGG